MGKVVGICVALLVLAIGVVLSSEGGGATPLFGTFRSLPLLLQAAWAVIVLVVLALLCCAVWLSYLLMQQRGAAQALELRLDGVRHGVKELVKGQVDAEAAVHQLARTDPEDAIAAVQQRLTEADRFAQVQHTRNQAGDLQARVDDIRAQQLALQERLAPVLERRRSIEQFFLELERRQKDIDRALEEIAGGDDGVALDLGLKNMVEFVKRSHGRCDDLERAGNVIAGLREDFGELGARLVPFASAEEGIANRVEELRATREKLTADIDSLQQTREGPLAEWVRKFSEEKRALESRLANLSEEFTRLAALHRDIPALCANFHRALDMLAIDAHTENVNDIDARSDGLAKFIETTQQHLEGAERRLEAALELKTRLADMQSRLVPLEAENGGVVNIVEDVKEARDSLAAKIRRLQESEDGDLAERVRQFTQSRKELEKRVAVLTEQFGKLATVRKDIAGLFEKLSRAVNPSAN